jgi:hypothetical protein
LAEKAAPSFGICWRLTHRSGLDISRWKNIQRVLLDIYPMNRERLAIMLLRPQFTQCEGVSATR